MQRKDRKDKLKEDYPLGEMIRQIRRAKGYTQDSFAEMLGVSKRTVSDWENLLTNPSHKTVKDIASVLNVTISELYGENIRIKNNEHSVTDISFSIRQNGNSFSFTRRDTGRRIRTYTSRVVNEPVFRTRYYDRMATERDFILYREMYMDKPFPEPVLCEEKFHHLDDAMKECLKIRDKDEFDRYIYERYIETHFYRKRKFRKAKVEIICDHGSRQKSVYERKRKNTLGTLKDFRYFKKRFMDEVIYLDPPKKNMVQKNLS